MSTAYIPVKAVNWVLKAASDDSSRKVLTDAAVVWIKGVSWLVATDAHRVHLVRLFKSDEHENIMVNLRLLRHEMRFHGANTLCLTMLRGKLSHDFGYIKWRSSDYSAIEELGKRTYKGFIAYCPLIRGEEKHKYPNIAKVIPEKVSPSNGVTICVQPRYIADAMALYATDGSLLTLAVKESSSAPIVVLPRASGLTNFAVIMPMATEESNVNAFNSQMGGEQ